MLRKDAAFPATAAKWGLECCARMPRSGDSCLYGGWNAAQGWRSSPQKRTGVVQRIVIFWKEKKRLNLSEHSE
jgi:hypothetical protein